MMMRGNLLIMGVLVLFSNQTPPQLPLLVMLISGNHLMMTVSNIRFYMMIVMVLVTINILVMWIVEGVV